MMAGGQHGGPRPNSGGRRAGAGRPAGSGWRPAITEMRVAAQEQMAIALPYLYPKLSATTVSATHFTAKRLRTKNM